MSYDVSLIRLKAGQDLSTAALRQALKQDDESGDVLSDLEQLAVAAFLTELRSADPTAIINEVRDDHGLRGFQVEDSAQWPYIQIDGRRGTLAWSLSAEPRALYRSLMQVTAAAAKHGYRAFDHQQGEFIEVSEDFATFMRQFANQWSSPAAFSAWLRDSDKDHAEPKQTATAPRNQTASASGSGPMAWVILALVLIWGAFKLHKAGYF